MMTNAWPESLLDFFPVCYSSLQLQFFREGMTDQQLWQAVLGELELLVSRANFSTWFKNTGVSQWENGRIIISVPNAFTHEWLKKKYHDAIVKAIRTITHDEVQEVYYKVESVATHAQNTNSIALTVAADAFAPSPDEARSAPSSTTGLNVRYTFDTFVVGKGNELAHAAALSVATQPGKTYNPLFIYGGVGLGKTHLLQAIGNAILREDPAKKVLYVTCERFTNEFIHAVRSGRGKEFKDTYRNVDLLLVDDIQFMTGKEGTQEEFVHTFNTLHQENKQVVLSSDRPPKAIATIEQRLLSRFEWGMIADISNLDLETRIAILESKCQARRVDVDHAVLHFLASSIQHNVRELEGALNRLIAHHELRRTPITLDMTKELFATLAAQKTRSAITVRHLLETVSNFYNITIDDVLGKRRTKRLALPRQIIMYLMRHEMKASYPMIGQELGGRDHTTAIHAFEKITREVENDEQLRQEVELLRQRIYNTA